jgi:hypothetical protein
MLGSLYVMRVGNGDVELAVSELRRFPIPTPRQMSTRLRLGVRL